MSIGLLKSDCVACFGSLVAVCAAEQTVRARSAVGLAVSPAKLARAFHLSSMARSIYLPGSAVQLHTSAAVECIRSRLVVLSPDSFWLLKPAQYAER